jgi:hypothetical protein
LNLLLVSLYEGATFMPAGNPPNCPDSRLAGASQQSGFESPSQAMFEFEAHEKVTRGMLVQIAATDYHRSRNSIPSFPGGKPAKKQK